MFDLRSEPKEFVAVSRDEAVAKACSHFDVQESELQIKELAGEQIGGLGTRVLVVAVPEGRRTPPSRDRDDDRSDRGRRESRDSRGGRGGRDRDRGGRGDRGGREARGGRDRDRGGRGGRRDAEPVSDLAAAEELSTEPSVGKAQGKLSEVGDFVLGLVERLKVGPFEISETDESDFTVFELRGPAARRLTSGDGRGADAVQLLANQVAPRIDEDAKRVVVDAEGDPDRREDFLTRIAHRAARRARDIERSVALDPMNGRDRRDIHVALRDEDGIATMSIGEGRYRQVVVVPEGAPDYEEAKRTSERAATEDSRPE